jgi:membrane protease YdiL (CAAX protease family)
MSTVTTVPRGRSNLGGGRLRAVGVVIGLLVAALVVSTALAVVVLVPLFATGVGLTDPIVLVASAIATQVGLLLVAAGYAWRTGHHVPVAVPSTRREVGWILGGTTLAVTIGAGGSVLLTQLGVTDEVASVIGDVAAANPVVLLILAGLSLVLVAPAEELLFRGVIQGRLRRAFGPVAAVVGATFLFAVIHVANFTSGGAVGVLAILGVLALAATVFGAAYERTRNLAVPILIHGLYNTVLVVASYVALVG